MEAQVSEYLKIVQLTRARTHKHTDMCIVLGIQQLILKGRVNYNCICKLQFKDIIYNIVIFGFSSGQLFGTRFKSIRLRNQKEKKMIIYMVNHVHYKYFFKLVTSGNKIQNLNEKQYVCLMLSIISAFRTTTFQCEPTVTKQYVGILL